MTIELRTLRQFVVIAELGSFRRAAEALFIAQPALTVSMRKLERAIGVVLFERGPRGATLTPAGAAMLQEARHTLRHAEEARQVARMVASGEGGRLRVGFVGSATYALLPRAVPAFRQRHPEVRLELVESTTVEMLERVHRHRLDAGLVRGPLAAAPGLQTWVVERDDAMIAVPAGHALVRRDEARLVDCAGEAFVSYSPREVPGLAAWVGALCLGAGFSPRIEQEAAQVQTVVSLVASGLGVALVPASTRYFSHPAVRFIRLADQAARHALSLSLILPQDTPSATALRWRDLLVALDASHAGSGQGGLA
ncbi:LysR family transcriptional regulator [Verticiella sediminum]|uniref:LysR family transcriptional regulator n=1 Tax=Verticiella sediminum TaxID=1247510 RepID=A0A556A865_9BURK|nr:LysR family transcriptional regulator [Verticiella sediminum]TSH89076.1 LysR family transcriptional regulator [Verticiella sediminum]